MKVYVILDLITFCVNFLFEFFRIDVIYYVAFERFDSEMHPA